MDGLEEWLPSGAQALDTETGLQLSGFHCMGWCGDDSLKPVGEKGDVTSLLAAYSNGETRALNQILPLVYDELRCLARQRRYRFAAPQGPGTTSLVHEAYLNLVDQTKTSW